MSGYRQFLFHFNKQNTTITRSLLEQGQDAGLLPDDFLLVASVHTDTRRSTTAGEGYFLHRTIWAFLVPKKAAAVVSFVYWGASTNFTENGGKGGRAFDKTVV